MNFIVHIWRNPHDGRIPWWRPWWVNIRLDDGYYLEGGLTVEKTGHAYVEWGHTAPTQRAAKRYASRFIGGYLAERDRRKPPGDDIRFMVDDAGRQS